MLSELRRAFLHADIFFVIDVLGARDRARLGMAWPHTKWRQHLCGVHRYSSAMPPLVPHAIGRLDFTGDDLPIASAHAVANGVRIGADTVLHCDCRLSMRYACNLQDTHYEIDGLGGGLRGWMTRACSRGGAPEMHRAPNR